jgi:SAM-dependent methyltransferase
MATIGMAVRKHYLEMPDPDSSGFFIPTLNNTGYMTTHLDYYSQKFVQYTSEAKSPVLDVGAAYGVASLAALSKGAEIICNDIDERHLAILTEEALRRGLNLSKLKTVLGDFSYELQLPKESLSGILIARVLHFFNGARIEYSLKKAYQWLKPGGKIFIVAETPYLKNFSDFIPEYEARVKRGDAWPGLMTDVQKYYKDHNLPPLLHGMDHSVLKRVLNNQGFIVEEMGFINRLDFPPNRRLDGRESIGVIAYKQH